jgi:hypothetical protein
MSCFGFLGVMRNMLTNGMLSKKRESLSSFFKFGCYGKRGQRKEKETAKSISAVLFLQVAKHS